MFNFLKKMFGGSEEHACCCGKTEAGKAVSDGGIPARVASVKDLEGFVEYVVKALVDVPDEVKVFTEDGDNGFKVIKIACRREDTGKIIGKKGKTIIALRSLVGGAAGRLQERVSVEVVD